MFFPWDSPIGITEMIMQNYFLENHLILKTSWHKTWLKEKKNMAQKLHFELNLSYCIPLLKLLDHVSLSIA